MQTQRKLTTSENELKQKSRELQDLQNAN